MTELNILVDIRCARPNWVYAEHLKDQGFDQSSYRLYINNDLLTERSWAWSDEYTVVENICIVNRKDLYTLRIVPIIKARAQARFSMHNFRVANTTVDIKDLGTSSITFKTS